MDSETLSLITIPLFSGAIGYLTNWSGVWMLFHPIRFYGFHVPGLAAVASIMPRKIQQIPGVMHGGVGWQGIIPSRAAKMGSICVDKGIAKLGSAGDFYKQLEPDAIAEHILDTARGDIREVVERVMEREHPQLWRDVPPQLREAVHARVQRQLPDIVRTVTDEIGENIDQLLDVKLMVIRHIDENPELANRVFLDVGKKELRFMINAGFFLGFALGIPTAFITHTFPFWWVLPICGVVVGYVTNWIGLWMIFEPVNERKIGPFKVHALFLRRQREIADVYAKIIADDIVTLGNIGEELLEGRRADRTRQMIETSMRPAIDRAVGITRSAVRVAVGADAYDAIRDSVAIEGVESTMTPLIADSEFSERQIGPGAQADRRAHADDVLRGLLRDAALGDARGRVAAAPARRRARIRRRRPAPADIRARMNEYDRDDPDQEREGGGDFSLNGGTPRDIVRAAPGLARIAAAAWWQTAQWTVRASTSATSKAVRAASLGTSPAELFRSTQADAREYVRRALGIVGVPKTEPGRGQSSSPLRERGAELLRRSADVRFEQSEHPAYERMLAELAPDEGRILRLLAVDGPQASVDVRTARPLSIGDELIAPGLSMIGAEAGARYGDRVPAYLNNLFRLGLIWFSREPVKSRRAYQVLEAQPDVLEALKRAGRGRTVRRSVHLTPFGQDFCSVCLDIDPDSPEQQPDEGLDDD